MTDSQDINAAFLEQLKLLRADYASRLCEKIEGIEAAWHIVAKDGGQEALANLHRLAHSLAGSGATFGFDDLSQHARALESLLQTLKETGRAANQEEQSRIAELLGNMRRDANLPPSPDKAPELLLPRSQPGFETGAAALPAPHSRLVYLVDDDRDFANDLALQIRHFGYAVLVFTRLADALEALRTEVPSALIMDIMFPEGELAGTEMLAALEPVQDRAPVIFLSSRADFLARLQALRAGGDAYFTKPVDINSLIDKLDAYTTATIPEPLRILIVDDEIETAMHYSAILNNSGMATAVIYDPAAIDFRLNDFRPDLILMDVYMPGCTGLELARIIRQQEDYVGTPIVFLSTETDIDKQMAAMTQGGDDFLTKPIAPSHLVSSVTTRAERARVLRSFMVRDGLTGLLNHTATREHLILELARAQRDGAPLSYAMVDIDSFKSVNDSYGHSIGDRVIKTMARMLQQRLRRVDVIGRYGGEEFAVILPGTDGPAAFALMDHIRTDFGGIRQHAGGEEFFITFSAGIASFPACGDGRRISEAADRALYQAKQTGRNRTVLAPA